MKSRLALLPRGFWILLPILAVALALTLRGGARRDAAADGRLFGFPLAELQTCEVRGPGRHVVLRRTAHGWELDGDVRDLPEPRSVARLIEVLQTSERSAGIAGDAGDPAYGLQGPGAWRLEVTAPQGRGDVTIGRRNPVTGHSYARDGDGGQVFVIADGLPSFLATLPDALRARDLWPGYAPAAVDTVRVRGRGAGAADLYARDGQGRWWLRQPADGLARAPAAQRYQGVRADRRREQGGTVWYRARDYALLNLMSLLADVRVLEFPPPAAEGRPAPDGELVVIATGADGRRHEVAFGGPAGEERVRGRRGGCDAPLVMTDQPLRNWDPGLPSCLHLGLLTATLAAADSFALTSPGLGEVAAVKVAGAWRVARPAGLSRLDEQAGDVVVLFDRTVIQDVLPAAGDDPATMAAAGPVYDLTAWLPATPDSPLAGAARVRLGVVGGRAAAALASAPESERAPGGGALFAIDPEILTTLRTFLLAAASGR
ncbi:MAG: hypothetical protein IPH09_05705 [bacterium]|nr:hypothetical protein [bacterium]